MDTGQTEQCLPGISQKGENYELIQKKPTDKACSRSTVNSRGEAKEKFVDSARAGHEDALLEVHCGAAGGGLADSVLLQAYVRCGHCVF